MTDQSIDTLMTKTATFAEQLLRAQGDVPPTFVLNFGDTIVPLMAAFEDSSDKEAKMSFLRSLITAYWPHCVTSMVESWYRRNVPPGDDYLPPSQCADAREGVMVAVATPTFETAAFHEIVRDANGAPERLVADVRSKDCTTLQGRMLGLYPATVPAPAEQIRLRRMIAECWSEETVAALEARARTPALGHAH